MNKHLLAVATLALCAAHAAMAQPTGVQRLAWLQGCWALTQGERSVEEQWTAPRAGSMLGLSRTLRGDKLVEHEFVIGSGGVMDSMLTWHLRQFRRLPGNVTSLKLFTLPPNP